MKNLREGILFCWAVIHISKAIYLAMSLNQEAVGYFSLVFMSPACSAMSFDTYTVDAQRFKLWCLIVYKLVSPSMEKKLWYFWDKYVSETLLIK